MRTLGSPISGSTLAEALAPVSVEAFLAEHWCKSFLHVPGRPGKFAGLLPWAELERILEEHRFPADRLKVVQRGERIADERYLVGGAAQPAINSAGLKNALSAGASMVLNSVDDLSPGVRAFAESVERELRLNCWCAAIAGWRTQNAFDLHWDAWSVLVLQVAGRKRWQVYRPTLPHPLLNGGSPVAAKPTEPPVWEGMLEDGDLLYLPRGWWHVAFPVDGPSLHLSYSVNPGTGVDVLHWLADQLTRHEDMRKELPLLAGPEARQRHLARLREIVTGALQTDCFDQCLAARDSKMLPRRRISLAQVGSRPASLTLDTKVRLAACRRLAFDLMSQAPGAPATFLVGEKQMNCAPDLVPALEALGNDPLTIRELCGKLRNPAAATQLKLFLAALMMSGVLAEATEPPTA
jgi:Cupin superfamily protein